MAFSSCLWVWVGPLLCPPNFLGKFSDRPDKGQRHRQHPPIGPSPSPSPYTYTYTYTSTYSYSISSSYPFSFLYSSTLSQLLVLSPIRLLVNKNVYRFAVYVYVSGPTKAVAENRSDVAGGCPKRHVPSGVASRQWLLIRQIIG